MMLNPNCQSSTEISNESAKTERVCLKNLKRQTPVSTGKKQIKAKYFAFFPMCNFYINDMQ
jgi:hypothetical protein